MTRSTAVRWACRLAAIVALGLVLDASAQNVKPSPKLPALGGVAVEITRATASPMEAPPGDALRITATVRSSGGPSGPFAVLLKLDARELGRQSGDLGPGAERPFTFQTTAPDRAGQVCYDLGLEGETGNKATMKGGSRACLRVTPRLVSTPGADPKTTSKLQRPEAAQTDAQGAPKSLAPGAIALKLDGSGSPQETERRFKALPDDARVQLKDGRTLTKRELVAESAQKREVSLARLKQSGGGGGSNFAALKAQHAAEQEAELAKARGQVEAQIRQLGADPSDEEQAAALKELEAIRAEARQLRARHASASATEKAQISARADLLMKRAKQLLGGPPVTMIQADAPSLLCQLVDCAKPKAFCAEGPTITGWVPFSGMRQGGVVALGGSCFGQPGTLRLKGLPGGNVMLDVVEWKHKAVAASIPTTLAVPGDTPVTVEVTRADGKKATSPPITFIPLRELKKVPRSAVSVNVCGGGLTDCNHCNDTTVHLETSSLNFCQFVVPSDATVRGEHIADCVLGCNHPGTDQYRITLKNHHRFHSATWSKDVSAAGEANATGSQATTAHVQRKTSVMINVPFWVTGWDWVRYEIDLYEEGPVNVPGW